MTDTQNIANDLNLCDMIEMFGNGKSKRDARRHRKDCFAAISEMNKADGLDGMTDDELIAALLDS